MTSPTASPNFLKLAPFAAICAIVAACSSETQPGNSGQGGKSGSGGAATGGKSSGGTPGSGGTSTVSGGTSSGSGGSSSGGTSSSSGGSGSGGSASGGSSSGGASSGGRSAAGGSGNGGGGAGASSGGVAGASSGGAAGSATGGSGGSGNGTTWVGSWASGQQLTESQNNPPVALANNTLRQVVHVSIGGSKLRVRLSNEYGTSDATLTKVHIAKTAGAGGIATDTDTALMFGGKASVTIPSGKAVTSDPVDFALAPLSNLTISIQFGTQSGGVTGHPGSRTTSYIQTGDAVSSATISSNSTKHWYFISAVDVMADSDSHAIAILGDSITDGRGTTDDGNDRWPDALAKRLQANAATAKIGVLNLGIGGNTVLSGGLGPTAKQRFDSDVVKQTGVKWAIVLEGVNDINNGATAQSLTDAFKEFVTKAHAANIKLFGGTITPLGTANASKEPVRTQVNTWIRAAGNFDACIDFDNAVHDPSNTSTLLKSYWFTGDNDGLHLNPTGYAKMAEAVDLSLFK